MDQALAKVLYVYFLIVTLHKVEIIVLIVWDPSGCHCYEGRKQQGLGSDIWQAEHSQVTRIPSLRSALNHCFLAFQPAKDSKEVLLTFTVHRGEKVITNGGLGRKINLDSAN